MTKAHNPWTESALHLWAQSESNTAGIQALKIVLNALGVDKDAPEKHLEVKSMQESVNAIQDYIASSLFNQDQARRSLHALNPDVYVELYFPLENKRYTERMTYTICQNKMVEWSKNSVTVSWWPVNFKTSDEAKAFAVKYLESVLRSVDTRQVAQ